jgi:hypothetical protein
MWPFRRKVVAPSEPPPEIAAVASMRAMPVNLSPTDEIKIEHAMYRLDAMCRHLDQSPSISDQRRSEFRAEARVHIANLMHVEQMDDVTARAYARRLGL